VGGRDHIEGLRSSRERQAAQRDQCDHVHYTATATVRPPPHAAEGKTHAAKAGIDENVPPHTLRRSFATHIHPGTSKICLVKKGLSHSEFFTTMIYNYIFDVQVESTLKSLRQAMAMIV